MTPSARRSMAIACSAVLHATALAGLVLLAPGPTQPAAPTRTSPVTASAPEVRHIVFVVTAPRPAGGGGGGGGGNRQRAPIRRAEAVGSDAITLRIAKPVATTGPATDVAVLPALVLDARPLASGSADHVGLPMGGVSFGTSTGPGSGGGVGDGVGTGIGSGRGPGVGHGSGGGTGGGVYRPGGAVSAPRVITEVKPTYTSEAVLGKIQGTVVLEFVVRANGEPSDIRIVRSLDRGLDEQAVIAIRQWRFAPGRLAGQPVDVLVTAMLDFLIR